MHMKGTVAGMAVLALLALAGERVTAQPPSGRMNRVIAQAEQGKVAFVNVDWAWIEMEQSPFIFPELQRRMAELKGPGSEAPKLTPVMRIPMDGDEPFRWVTKQVLNIGVANIVFPQVESGTHALNAVRAMRYPPQRGAKYPEPAGLRSFGPGRAARYWGMPTAEYVRKADVWPLNPEGEMLAIMMIETRAGVNHIEEILAVPGVGAVFIGPYDLGMSLGVGVPTPAIPPETESAIQTVRRACAVQPQVICGIAGVNVKDRDRRVAEGFRLIQLIGGPAN
jgi:4-hydroxy-2-oxoheptanedioate aldolase